LEEALAYSQSRVAFGSSLAEFGATRSKLADMATSIDAARLLTWRAAANRDVGSGDGPRESSMAKLFATEMAQGVTYEAVQIHGGYGYSKEFRVERLYRDVRVTTIYEGTSEVQRIIISRSILGQTS